MNVNSYWGWAPGPVVVQPAYAPALVAFFGGPAVSVSVGVGLPFVSWCPLGFGEPVIPWWGGARFAGRPYWGGWGGPRIVNNVVINNRWVNGGYVGRYQNAMVHNAVVGLDRDRFRGGGRPFRVQDASNLRPLRGNLGVRPAAHSFVANDGRGQRPPERFRNRAVVATRAARDPIHRLRAQGVDVASARDASPKARIVHPRGGGADRMASGRGPNDAGRSVRTAVTSVRSRRRRGGVNRVDRAPSAVSSALVQRERGRDFASPTARQDGGRLTRAAPTRPDFRVTPLPDHGERFARPTPAPHMAPERQQARASSSRAHASSPRIR